ncbi:tetratricopeptide repeat protein [Anabaena sp. UHCC 0253]|uniref:tetratricopeptide repeat protein n=1 Tax=Anabaena sp. UHCC 0253 TaxID=2590019 RepID=UPI0014456201|nr:tetratricopeptide repeat protein [Anabaena sp. UHCC 0253]MTJ55931.1 tetratricopeptide repeat protein [Anabaena sp. UHCC 0253]
MEVSLEISSDSPWLYYYLGRYLEEMGQLKESITYHELGIQESEKFQDEMFLACNHLGIGISQQRYCSDSQEAEWHLLQALNSFKTRKYLYLQAHTLVNLGSCYDRFNNSKLAIDCYQESELILRNIENYFDLGRILYSLGIAYLNINKFPESEKVFLEAKQLCKDNNNLYFLALTLYGIGWLEYKRGNFEISQNYLEDSIRQLNQAKESGIGAIQLSFPEIEGNIYILASAAYSKGSSPNFEAGEKYLEDAKNAYLQLDYSKTKLLNVLANRARLYEYSKKWSAAISAFLELLVEGELLNSNRTITDAATHLILIHYKKSASFTEWIKLMQRLKWAGILILAKEYFRQIHRFSRLLKWRRK